MSADEFAGLWRRKLIEVALPLDVINEAAVAEKKKRHGHPSSLHLWWSRKPLAACRAVLFASLVDDPSCDDSLTIKEQNVRRKELFDLIGRLVQWDNSNDPVVLAEARAEIEKSCNGPPPPGARPVCRGRIDPVGDPAAWPGSLRQ